MGAFWNGMSSSPVGSVSRVMVPPDTAPRSLSRGRVLDHLPVGRNQLLHSPHWHRLFPPGGPSPFSAAPLTSPKPSAAGPYACPELYLHLGCGGRCLAHLHGPTS